MNDPFDTAQGDHMTSGRLAGKVASITGSDSGIGQATAIEMAREGAAGVVVDYLHDRSGGEDTCKEAEALGATAVLVHADISDKAQVAAMFDQALDAFGAVDIVMNNAGVDASGTHRHRFGSTSQPGPGHGADAFQPAGDGRPRPAGQAGAEHPVQTRRGASRDRPARCVPGLERRRLVTGSTYVMDGDLMQNHGQGA